MELGFLIAVHEHDLVRVRVSVRARIRVRIRVRKLIDQDEAARGGICD